MGSRVTFAGAGVTPKLSMPANTRPRKERRANMSTTTEKPPVTKTSTKYFGRAMKRVEDPRLLRGNATYVDDLQLAGGVHAEFVRSPHANANIRSINTDAAKKLPGVIGVFTGADINEKAGPLPCASPLPAGT